MNPSAPGADSGPSGIKDLRERLERRTAFAFSLEERRGLMLAATIRTAAIAVILVWQVFDNPNSGLAYVFDLSAVAAFGVLGVLQYLCARYRFHMNVLKYVFVLIDCLLLSVVLGFENPFRDFKVPASFVMNGSPFALFFIFLMQSTFSLRPRLVLWCGACIALARTGMLLRVLEQPGVFTSLDLPDQSSEALIAASANPDFILLGYWGVEVIATLCVATGLAVVVARSKRLVESRSLAERGRASLARYFSPNVVDRLSGVQTILGTVREQNVAVLFADIVAFTKLCEKKSPDAVIALLREYHDRLGRAVFDNDGTLDKYLGDGLMATFGTPEAGPRDTVNALRCARDMIAALEAWNAERAAVRQGPVRVGIGIHYGPVIAGDIGNARRLEYSVVGDTVNIASRLEELTRSLDTNLVVSDSLVQTIDRDTADGRALLRGLHDGGVRTLRGRESGVHVWLLEPPGTTATA